MQVLFRPKILSCECPGHNFVPTLGVHIDKKLNNTSNSSSIGGRYTPPPILEILVPESGYFFFPVCKFTIQNNSSQSILFYSQLKLLESLESMQEYQNYSTWNPVNKPESGSQYNCRNKIFTLNKN